MNAQQTGPILRGCLCGDVRYAIDTPIVAARQCWCRDCQHLACGSASTSIIVEVAGLRIEGPLAEYRNMADSGHHMIRLFCLRCGTQVLSAAEENTHYIAVRVGTLDDPNLGAPEGVIWTDSAPKWAFLPPDLPRSDKQPLISPWPLHQGGRSHPIIAPEPWKADA